MNYYFERHNSNSSRLQNGSCDTASTRLGSRASVISSRCLGLGDLNSERLLKSLLSTRIVSARFEVFNF